MLVEISGDFWPGTSGIVHIENDGYSFRPDLLYLVRTVRGNFIPKRYGSPVRFAFERIAVMTPLYLSGKLF